MTIPISDFFAAHGAPLANIRRSWGAVRRDDGAVLLRVWSDRVIEHNGAQCVQLTHLEKYGNSPDAGYYYKERVDHVRRIMRGAPCLLVFCDPVNADPSSRAIKSYKPELVLGVEPVLIDGDFYITF